MGWFKDLSETVGKAIPNEFAKSNSWAKYIPFWGQISQIVGGVDAGTTSYADKRDRGAGSGESLFAAGQNMYSGALGSRDPGIHGSPNVNRDPWNMAGQVGNLFSVGAGNQVSPNYGSILNIANNPYFNKSADKDSFQTASISGATWMDTVQKLTKAQRTVSESGKGEDDEPTKEDFKSMGITVNDIVSKMQTSYPLTSKEKTFITSISGILNKSGVLDKSKLDMIQDMYSTDQNKYTGFIA